MSDFNDQGGVKSPMATIAALCARLAESERLRADDIEILTGDVRRRDELIATLRQRVALAEAMADAYDTWDASENEKFTHEVWQKRQRLCAAFMDARDAFRALSSPPPHDGEGK